MGGPLGKKKSALRGTGRKEVVLCIAGRVSCRPLRTPRRADFFLAWGSVYSVLKLRGAPKIPPTDAGEWVAPIGERIIQNGHVPRNLWGILVPRNVNASSACR